MGQAVALHVPQPLHPLEAADEGRTVDLGQDQALAGLFVGLDSPVVLVDGPLLLQLSPADPPVEVLNSLE